MPTFENGFYVVTSDGISARGVSLKDCIESVNLKKKTKYYVCVFIFDQGLNEEIRKKILCLYYVSDFGRIEVCHDLSDEQRAIIKDHVKGFTILDFTK